MAETIQDSTEAPTLTSVFTCDVCQRTMQDHSEIRLLRPTNALPEETTVITMHKDCVDRFLDEHSGRWSQYTYDSPDAKWLLPLLV